MTPLSPVGCDSCSVFITNFPIVLLYLINITHYATTNIFMFKLLNCFFLIYIINIVVQCFLFILTVVFRSHLFIWMRAPVPSDMSKRNLSVIKCKQEPNVQAVSSSLYSSCEPSNGVSELLSLSLCWLPIVKKLIITESPLNLLNHIAGKAILFEL